MCRVRENLGGSNKNGSPKSFLKGPLVPPEKGVFRPTKTTPVHTLGRGSVEGPLGIHRKKLQEKNLPKTLNLP